MPNENKTNPQLIPISVIHDLPGLPIPKMPDASYGGLVTSIQNKGVQEPLILRLRKDGEYELVAGYRRRRAAELAELKELPAHVYDMSSKEALEYAAKHKVHPDTPIPGKLLEKTEPHKEEKPKETPAKEAKPKEVPKEKAAEPAKKAEEKKPAEEKKTAEKKPKETKAAKAEKKAEEEAPTGPAAAGPTGTTISKVLESRLTPPGEKDLKALPQPKENEAFSVMLHPGYLEKAEYNNFSVDRESDDFKELYKSIENFGVREPVIATPGENGKLQIVSGQRRHLIASELNYPVPTIIQKLDPDDARILVADSNLHREKISTYDLSRALRMKADSMKKKVGRRKLGDDSAKGWDTSEVLAKEMGMSATKLNRLMKLSEATRDVCSLVDEGTLQVSIAYNIAFLEPKVQDSVAHLIDLGYKVSNENTNILKNVAKSETLTEQKIRDVLDGKYPPKPEIKQPPKAEPAPIAPAPAPIPTTVPAAPAAPTTPTMAPTVLPESPDVAAPANTEKPPLPYVG
ncbi:MAG: ParB N-terminal domain-containing protein, partial [Oscillospiraceae bacterium]|nr:ParB N-terminal domain-containing protein [Oscillospiraceae bacterium]